MSFSSSCCLERSSKPHGNQQMIEPCRSVVCRGLFHLLEFLKGPDYDEFAEVSEVAPRVVGGVLSPVRGEGRRRGVGQDQPRRDRPRNRAAMSGSWGIGVERGKLLPLK